MIPIWNPMSTLNMALLTIILTVAHTSYIMRSWSLTEGCPTRSGTPLISDSKRLQGRTATRGEGVLQAARLYHSVDKSRGIGTLYYSSLKPSEPRAGEPRQPNKDY